MKRIYFILGIFIFFLLILNVNAATLDNQIQSILNIFKNLFQTSTQVQQNQIQNIPTSTSFQVPNSLQIPNIVLDFERAKIEAVKKVAPAVVSIVATKDIEIIQRGFFIPPDLIPPEFQEIFPREFFYEQQPQKRTEKRKISSGSGFIISEDGLILTNKHVVSDDNAEYTVFLNDGRKFKAKILAKHPADDLAILKIDAKNLPYAILGDSNKLELGQTVIAIGNALGEFQNTVSVGVVSGLRRNITASDNYGNIEQLESLIQTDAAINYGNSGGPLINLKGEVIGINTAIVSGAQNIGFAIPIERAIKMLEKVKKTGKIQVPFLGIRYIILTEEIAKIRGFKVDYGALIEGSGSIPGVVPDSPASKAGLREGDIILEIDGEKITKDNTLASIILNKEVGQKVKLKVLRNNEREIYIDVILGERPEEIKY
jgi:serine protease Do